MFPSFEPVPVFVEYDSRGTRVRKHFDDGLDPQVRWFYSAKSKAGKKPTLRRSDGFPSHVSPPEKAEPVYIRYDGSKVVKGVRRRVLKRFKDGLTREAKEFFQAMVRENKYPVILAEDLTPMFGPDSTYQKPQPEPAFADRVLTQGELFCTKPDQLPD